MRAAGAETSQEHVIEQAADEGWTRSEWFKLHLRSPASDTRQELSTLPPLPPHKTVVDVFADLLAYLFNCTRTYIQETHPAGAQFWSSIAQNIDFVLTHPNGWEGRQQSLMRLAAVQAKLVPNSDAGRARVSFVTEGEASLHFCLNKGLISANKNNKGIIIVDAGGGTIDLSAYSELKSDGKVSYVESAAALCLFKGSVMVRRNAEIYIEGHLKGSRYFDRAADIVDSFDKTAKLTTKNSTIPAYVKFGGMNDNEAAYNIRGGKLVIPGAEVARFFQPSVTSIAQAVLSQRSEAKTTTPSVYLVGGFAASTYLYTQLRETLVPLGIDVCRPDSHANKAVAEGGVLYVLDHQVSARMARFTYGAPGSEQYYQSNPDHARRQAKSYIDVHDGERLIGGCFFPIIRTGSLVTETQEFRYTFYTTFANLAEATSISSEIWVYRGCRQNPQWIDNDPESYGVLCVVEADVLKATRRLSPLYGKRGKPYYQFDYVVVLLFGLTELRAQLSWTENGVEKRSPAKVVYVDE